MPDFKYLILGGGMAADAAARAIRELDKDGDIGVLCEEPDPPYARPPLSKGLWKGEPLESVWKHTDEVGAALLLGKRAVRIEPDARRVVDHRGASYGYHKLLIATGARTRKLVTGGENVVYFRTLADYRRVREVAVKGKRVVVIGGGFIGAEMAAALAGQECKVTMVVSGPGIGGRIFPADLVRFLNGYYEERGVALQPGRSALGHQSRGRKHSVAVLGGADVPADLVVAGIGVQPNAELAEAAGLPAGDGIVVDERLRAGRPEIFAAGDVARFPSPALGGAVRVEHEDNALAMGRYAGRAMAGADDGPFTHLPFFYSDLFDLGYEAVGALDPRLETVADWKVPFREGVVYYLENKRVRGVLLWGIFGKVDAARALIAEKREVTGSVKGWV